MNRREFLMSTLAAFALAALPKLTIAETIAVSEKVKQQINTRFWIYALAAEGPE